MPGVRGSNRFLAVPHEHASHRLRQSGASVLVLVGFPGVRRCSTARGAVGSSRGVSRARESRRSGRLLADAICRTAQLGAEKGCRGVQACADTRQVRAIYLHPSSELGQSPRTPSSRPAHEGDLPNPPQPRLGRERWASSPPHLGARWGRGRTRDDASHWEMTKDDEQSKTIVP